MTTLFAEEKTRLGPVQVSLRDYQEEAIDAIRDRFIKGDRSTLLVLPTGTGKTITFGSVARRTIERGGRVLILAHRDELIQQAAAKLDLLGVEVGIEKAEQQARAIFNPDCVIASVATMQRKRLASWPRDHFRLIITDEAHHATADSYRRIYAHFNAYHLGVTATADRADEESVGDVFKSIAYEMSLWDAMTAPDPGPYLCRLRFVQCDVEIDLRQIRTTAGDFNQSDLEERIRPLIDTLANSIRQEIGDRKTLVFTPDVGSAMAMATALKSLGFKADYSAGDDSQRKHKVQEFHKGRLQILCNCALLTEGFDCPDVSAIVLCRPTKSRPLYAQMVGRGTRLANNKKDCLIVDFNYLTTKHDLVKPVELFDTSHTDTEALEIAQKLLLDSPGSDVMEAIERGTAEHKQRQLIRIMAKERQVNYRKVSYDPLSVCDTLGMTYRAPVSNDPCSNPATAAQLGCLDKFGVEGCENMSRTRASTMIDMLISRAQKGLASMKQVTYLIRQGVDADEARAMTRDEASAYLEAKWGPRKKQTAQ